MGHGRQSGINVLNISNPESPQYLGTVDMISGSGPQAIKAIGNLVYIAAGNGGLVIVDVTRPHQPSVIGRYGNIWASGIDVVDDLAYVSVVPRGLFIIDVSDPASPVFLSQYQTQNASLEEIQVRDNLAFIVDDYHGLLVINVHDPIHPEFLYQYDAVLFSNGISVFGDMVYLASIEGGLKVFRVSNNPNWTPTPTQSPTATAMPTSTATLTPTVTPTVTPTPTPEPTAHYLTFLPLLIESPLR